MALREKLDSYNEPIVIGPENDPMTVDAQLAVEAWNRTTVADGAWLQQNAIGPLSARDIVLANAIDDTNDALSALSVQMTGTDGRSLKSVNGRFFSAGEAWEGSKDAIVPDGTLVNKDETVYIPKNDEVILSMNDDGGHAFQLQLKPNEIGYRYIAGASTAEGQGTIPVMKYKYDTQAGEFIPLIKKTDLPVGSGWYGVRNGNFEEIDWPSADDVTIGVNENNQLYVKNFGEPKWIKTSNSGYIDGDAMPEDVESYLHGTKISATSATYSTIIGSSSKLGRVEFSNIAVDGSTFDEKSNVNATVGFFDNCSMGPSASLNQSLWFAEAGQISARNIVENSLILTNACFTSEASAGGGRHTGIINLNGGNNYDKSNTDLIVAGGGNTVTDNEYALMAGGGNTLTDNEYALMAGGGLNIQESQYSVVLGGGANVYNASYSFINANGARINNVSNSFINQNGGTLNFVKYSVVVGENNQCSADGIKYCYITGSGNHATQYPAMYSIFAGRDIEYGNQSFAMAMGEFIQTKGSYVATLGSNTSAYADYSFAFGDHNFLAGSSAIGVLGNNNAMCIDKSFVLGDSNLVYTNPNQMVIGNSNSAYHGSNSLTVGDLNENDGYNNGVFGYNNIIGGGGNQLVIGQENAVNNSYVGMFGEKLRTSCDMQVQIGKFNVGYSDSMLEIGYGNANERKTVFRVTTAGDVYIAGQVHSNQQTMTATV